MKHSLIGLDIGARWVKAAQWTRNGGWSLRAVAWPRRTPGAGLSEEECGRIAASLDRRGLVGDGVVLIAPAEKARIAEIELPAAAVGAGRLAAARMELARVCRIEPGSFEFGVWDVARQARGGEVAVAAAVLPHQEADAMVLPLQSAGLAVEAIRATGEAYGTLLGSAARGRIDTVVDIGSSALSLAVLVGGVCVYERRLADLGTDSMTHAVAAAFKLPPAAAEHILQSVVAEPDGPVAPVLTGVFRTFGARIGEEVAVSLEYASHRYPQASDGRIVAVGGGACHAPILAAAGQALGATVETPVEWATRVSDPFTPPWPVVAAAAMLVAPTGGLAR